VRVKVCGLRGLEEARWAVEAGADLLGFIFVPGVRRFVEPREVARILDTLRADYRDLPEAVGVFVNAPLEEVREAVRLCRLDRVQLCGEEDLDYARAVGRPVLRVVPLPDGPADPATVTALSEHLARLEAHGLLPLLDRPGRGRQRGGTGQPANWAMAGELARLGHRFLLAGGLTPENVAHAIATARPWGVDVSSGVEVDGRKDPHRIRAFVEAVRQAERARAG